jgi:photosystem II stability/assembly factor-like uncharacterized protein
LARQASLLGALGVAMVIGAAVALATSGPSTSALLGDTSKPRGSLNSTPTPSGAPTPTPSVSRSGQLTGLVRVAVSGDRAVLSNEDRLIVVDAAGSTPITPPAGVQGMVAAPKNLQRVIAGGGGIRYSDDGGKTWKATRTNPPLPGPYVALLIDPDDPDVWFFRHGSKLLRTRDAGASWRELTGLPDLSAPLMAFGAKQDEELLLDGSTVVLLDDNGNQLSVRGSLPAAAQSAAVLGDAVLASAADGKVYSSTSTQGWTATTAPMAGPIAGAAGHAWVADGAAALGVAGRVSATRDGQTWTPGTGLPVDQSIVGLGVDRAGTTVVAYGAGGDLYRSTDGGITFTLFSSALRG